MREQTRKGKYIALAFAVPCVGMLMLMLINGYHPFGKYAMLYSDNYHQYYPFFLTFRRALRRGDSLLYTWSVGMGVDFLSMIAYYLASPLNLLSILVPDSQVLNFFSLLVPVKLGFAGMFFALFLRSLYGRDDLSLPLFGGFYALCAWALGYQWNLMWLDTFALLPLVMLGMVQLLRDGKFVLYTLALFLAVYSNYYIGVFICYFVFLSFFCYEICRGRGWKRFFRDFFCIGVFSLLAIGMTAILTVSTLAALQTTQSSVNKFPATFRLNIASSHTFLGLLDAMRTVAGNMGGGLEPSFKEGLPNLYCGVGSILLGFLFLLSEDVKWRDKLCCLFLILFFNVSFIIRQLDYIWHGFHFPNMIPYRFSFLHSFVLLYMAYRAWLVRRKFDFLQILAAGFMTAAVICCSNDLFSTQPADLFGTTVEFHVYLIYNVSFLLLYLGFLMWGSLRGKMKEETREEMLRVRHLVRRRSTRSRTAVFVVMLLELCAALTAFGSFFPGTNVTAYPKGTEEAASMIRYMHEREKDTPFFRAETNHSQTLNDGALNDYFGVSAFTSSANVHITEFMRALGYGAKNTYNRYCFEESSPVANLFLNLKYMIDRDGRELNNSYFRQIHRYGRVSLYQNEAYLPMGFLTEPELEDLDFLSSTGDFAFQNDLFWSATGIPGQVWHLIPETNLEIIGNGTTISNQNSEGYCAYSDPASGANVIYSYVADRDGFACITLDLPKRNDFYVSVNGTELYRETISLPQMLAIQDVQAGDAIDIRIMCKNEENGTARVNVAILDTDLFALGYSRLSSSVLELTSFTGTRMEGTIDCDRDGLLYTSIPQNGNWFAYVDGEEVQTTLAADCMLAIPMTEGSHTVTFVYRNAAFLLGTLVTVCSAAIFALITFLVYRPGRKKPAEILDVPVAPEALLSPEETQEEPLPEPPPTDEPEPNE